MPRRAWQATVHGLARVRHDLESTPPSLFKKYFSNWPFWFLSHDGPSVDKLLFVGQIWAKVCFYKLTFIGAQTCLIVHILLMAAFRVQRHSWIAAAKVRSCSRDSWLTKSVLSTLWRFREKCLSTLDSMNHEINFVILETHACKMEEIIFKKEEKSEKWNRSKI